MCAMTTCTYEGRTLAAPSPAMDVDPTPPVALHFTGVTLGAAKRALILAATYPWFEWNMLPAAHAPSTCATARTAALGTIAS